VQAPSEHHSDEIIRCTGENFDDGLTGAPCAIREERTKCESRRGLSYATRLITVAVYRSAATVFKDVICFCQWKTAPPPKR
jgi:hypothetical protein